MKWILVLVAGLVMQAVLAAAEPLPAPTHAYELRNIRVVDGDTLEADILMPWNITLRKQMIRCSDFDAWESSKRRRSVEVTDDEVERGELATRAVERLVEASTLYAAPPEGEGRDNYGRILARIYFRPANPDPPAGPLEPLESLAVFMHRENHVRIRSIDLPAE